jgi:hypothetical protein
VPITSSPYYLQANCAFQVRAAHNGDTLNFTESNKSANYTTNLLRGQAGYTSLVVYDANYHAWDMLYLQFNNAATAGEDSHYDAAKLSGTGLDFYSLSGDNKKLSIDARPFTADKVIPLGFTSSYAQEYIIKAEGVSVPAGKQIYLHDKLLRQYVALQQGAEYRFSVTSDKTTQGDNRFEISMEPTAIAGSPSPVFNVQMEPNPATDNVTVRINSGLKEAISIRVLSLSGESVYNTSLTGKFGGEATISLNGFAAGIYMVEVTSGAGKIVQKLVKE